MRRPSRTRRQPRPESTARAVVPRHASKALDVCRTSIGLHATAAGAWGDPVMTPACRPARTPTTYARKLGRSVPLAAISFRHPPEVIYPAVTLDSAGEKARVLGWPPNTVFALMCGAAVLCCIPMAMPQGHLVAFC